MKLFRVGHAQLGSITEFVVWAEDDTNARLYAADGAQKLNPRLQGEGVLTFMNNLTVHEVFLNPGVLFKHVTQVH